MSSLACLALSAIEAVGQLFLWLVLEVVSPIFKVLALLAEVVVYSLADVLGMLLMLPAVVVALILAAVGLATAGVGAVFALLLVEIWSSVPHGVLFAGGLAMVLLILLGKAGPPAQANSAPDGVLVGTSDWDIA